MNTCRKYAALAVSIAFIVMPALALAQSYDNESAEGNCNDEMNESMGCGSSQYNYYAYTPAPLQYTYYPSTQNMYAPAQQYNYYPSSQNYNANPYGYSSASHNPYSSYIPASAMPYVDYGLQVAQQYMSPKYGYGYSYGQPVQTGYNPTYGYSQPQSYSYPSGTYGPFNMPLCYWSDYPTYAPCGKDPQQWIQDPYTGRWY